MLIPFKCHAEEFGFYFTAMKCFKPSVTWSDLCVWKRILGTAGKGGDEEIWKQEAGPVWVPPCEEETKEREPCPGIPSLLPVLLKEMGDFNFPPPGRLPLGGSSI